MMGKKISTETRALIEALSREGKTQREISGRTKLCTETIRTIQKSIGLQPQPHKRTRGRLTQQEKKEVRRLYKKGWLIESIAKRLNVTRNTVTRAMRAMGLPRLRPLPETKILAMMRDRVPQRQIAKLLKVPYRRVFQFCRKHGFAHPRHVMTAAKIAAIDNAILNREATAFSIAKNYNASYTYTLKRAHQILGCQRFLGISNPPLTSYFPSRPPQPMKRDTMMSAEQFVRNFFPFSVRAGAVITDSDVTIAAQTLLEARRLFFGSPPNEAQYLAELSRFVAEHLHVAAHAREGWVH